MKTVLLLIDLQRDYFPGGAMELAGAEAAGARAARLLAGCRERSLPALHLRHESTRPGATFFRPGTPGAEIQPCAAPLAGEDVILKNFPSGFRGTPLLERLLVAGMMTHMCVDTTVRAAADLGFACWLAGDACATRELAFGGVRVPADHVQAAYLAGLDGAFARVAPVDELLAALDGDA